MASPAQLQIDFTARPGSCAPDCGHCSDPCPWGDPDDDTLSFDEWFALVPPVCKLWLPTRAKGGTTP